MDVPANASAETGGFHLAYKQNVPTDFQPYQGPSLFVFGKQMKLHEQHEESSTKNDKEEKTNICSPWVRQHRATTAPPTISRRRDPKVVDFIDYLNSSRCTIARWRKARTAQLLSLPYFSLSPLPHPLRDSDSTISGESLRSIPENYSTKRVCFIAADNGKYPKRFEYLTNSCFIHFGTFICIIPFSSRISPSCLYIQRATM